jgi:hypothetical protein
MTNLLDRYLALCEEAPTPWAFSEIHDIAGDGIIVDANGEKVCRVYGENRDAQMVGTIILFAVNKVAELATALKDTAPRS